MSAVSRVSGHVSWASCQGVKPVGEGIEAALAPGGL